MALICEKCGKKVGMLSNDPMKLINDRILCYTCAEPISDKMNDLYSIKTKVEFDFLKNEILEKCSEFYNDTVTKDIEKKIESIYNQTNIVHTEQQTTKKTFIENYKLTTGFEFSGYKITKYIGVISGQVVLGTGFLSELTASFADFLERSQKSSLTN